MKKQSVSLTNYNLMESQTNKEDKTSLFLDFLPQYRHLNDVYTEIIEKSDLTYSKQCFITDFYKKNKDTAQ